MVPLANVKSLPAFNMLDRARESGRLKGVRAVIENSSGNTVFSLAVIARAFGIGRTKAIVSHEVSRGKLQLLRLFGTEVMVNEEPICPDPRDIESGIHKAKRQGVKSGWFNPGEYDNEANPEAHRRWTGPQIWRQTRGRIDIFCAGVGTTGTLVGAGGYLKKKSKGVSVVAVARLANNPVPGVRTPNLLREIAFDWRAVADHMEEIGTKEAYEKSLLLCQAGLLAGPSSGFALAGLLAFLKKQKSAGLLKVKKKKEITAVFVCPDSPFPYLDEYFEHLDESYFPQITNSHLLADRKPSEFASSHVGSHEWEVDCRRAHDAVYAHPVLQTWERVNAGRAVDIRPDVVALDVRTPEEYRHAHLPGARNIEHTEVIARTRTLSAQWKRKKVVVICRSGKRSMIAVEHLRASGVEAVSVAGGMIEWSGLDLPRWRPAVCSEFGKGKKRPQEHK
jgi:cysteine synthase/rhodanese-related sulfurtransferase